MHYAPWAAIAVVYLAVLGCRSSPPPQLEPPPSPLRGIDFQAEISLLRASPARVSTTMTIVNRRPTPALLTFPSACLGLLRVYEESARTVPVWEQEAGEACPASQERIPLLPGEEREVRLPHVEVREILGTELPGGTYRFTVLVAPGGQVLEVEAGEVDLARIRRSPD